ncbi:MAG: amidohydrolase family protein [Myxococcota bacterium]|nr:amidohydrolase family protein [Myxococcota bacterium]
MDRRHHDYADSSLRSCPAPPASLVPRGHSSDPFACPCCSNVFSEALRLAGVDLASHARALRLGEKRELASLFVTHAEIMTMDETCPRADSIWIDGGKIAWIGLAQDRPEASQGLDEFDCAGRFVMPGFVEPHMHLAPLALLQPFENVGPFRFETTAQAIDRLAEVARETPEDDWVLGRQFDPSLQEGPPALTRSMLDRASTRHPIFVYNASLHLAYCNTRALEIAGITAETEDPPASEIVRDSNGEPNGVLKAGPAMALVARHNPSLRGKNAAEACLKVFNHANRVGITTLCDQGTGLFQGTRELDLYEALRTSQRMTARFRYSLGNTLAERWDQTEIAWGQGDEWVRATGWKIVSDGSNQGRTGLQREPFLGSDENGIAYIEPEELEAAVEQRLREGWPLCVHANGDAAIDRALAAFERADQLGLDPGGRRSRIEHCSILHDEHIERMAALGISPSFLIGHVYYWGHAFIHDLFGPEKAAKLDRTASCEKAGIRWTLHSDDPVTEMNPLRCIENAVTRKLWKGDGLLAPEERISVDAALRASTIDAAWQCHSDQEVGSLEPGKYADFVVLDADPRQVEADDLGAIKILETWVNGTQVYSA